MKNIDFSSTAVKKAVNAEISQNPVSIYSGLGSVASVLYMVLFGVTSPAFALSLGLLLLSGSSFIFNKFFREEVFEKKYVEKLRYELQANAQEMLDGLRNELKSELKAGKHYCLQFKIKLKAEDVFAFNNIPMD